MIRILVQEGDSERATHVVDRSAIRIGRDPSNDVIVRDRFVSARHGEIRIGAEGLSYEDFCTTNGSRVDRAGEILPVDSSCAHRIRLREGDELLLGDGKHPVRLRLEPAPARVFGRGGIVAPPRAARPAELDAAQEDTMVLVPQELDREILLALHRLTCRLAAQCEPDAVLDAFADATLLAFPRASQVSVWLVGTGTGDFLPALARGRKGATSVRPVSRTVRDRVLSHGKALAFSDGEEGFDLAESLHDSSVRAGLCAPLWDGRRVRGLVQVDSRGMRGGSPFGPGDLETLVVFAHQAAMALQNARLHEELRRGAEEVIQGLVAALEAKDPFTAGHSEVVASLCEATCLALGLEPGLTRTIRRAALVHDIGKIGMPYEVLNKKGALSPQERAPLDSHPELGAGMVQPLPFLAELVPIVRHHHERWDGRGRPDGLAGESIPLGARILAVCDAWHSLGTDRAHRDGIPPEAVAAELQRLAGTCYDPAIVEAFLELVADRAAADRTALAPAVAPAQGGSSRG